MTASPLNKLATVLVRNKAPIPLPGSGGGMGLFAPTGAPTTQAIDAFSSVGTLFAIVNRTSNATSQVDWRLYRRARSGTKEDRTEVTSHAALDLWNHPNPTTTQQAFIEGFQQHIDLTGESFWVIGRDGASTMPLELWYVRPDRMSVVVSKSEITGYVYRGPNNEKVPLKVDQVIMLKMPNPGDLWRGMGPVQSILTELDAYRATADYNFNFFRNSAEPGGVLETDVTLSEPEFKQVSTRWNEQHRGTSNSHRVAVLEGGLTWKSTQLTMRDMQFKDLREVSRDTIREAYSFPKSMLGASDDVNRAVAEAGLAMFAQWLLVPRLERIKQALNFMLLPLYGTTDLEFDYDNPVPVNAEDERADLTASTAAAATLHGLGLDIDDVLETVGLPAMEHTATIAGAGRSLSVAEVLQKIYLAVDVVITSDEAREIANAAGANLTGSPDLAGRSVGGT